MLGVTIHRRLPTKDNIILLLTAKPQLRTEVLNDYLSAFYEYSNYNDFVSCRSCVCVTTTCVTQQILNEKTYFKALFVSTGFSTFVFIMVM